MATISVGDLTPRNQYTATSGQTVFAYGFPIFVDTDLKVYNGSTLLTLTANYTVSGAATDNGGNVTLGSGATAGDIITIYRDMPVARTSDYQANGDLLAETLNDDLDKIVLMVQQVEDQVNNNTLKVDQFDTSVDLTLPVKDTRKGTVLGFNATSGAPEAGPTIANVNSLSAITANINTVAGIASNVTTVAGNNSNVSTVAGISGNVSTVAGISSNVTSVAGNATNINAVAADATDIGAVAAKATQIGLLGTSDAIADMNTLGTSAIVADMAILGTADVVADMNTLAHADVVSDMNTLATSDIISDLNTLASSAIVDDLNILATSANVTNMATLGASGVVGNVATVSGIASNVSTVAGISSNVTTVAGAASAVSTVASAIANVNTTASNITGVNSFAARYRVASSAPSSDLDEGDLYFNTSANALYYYNGSAWVIIATYSHPNHTGEVTSTGDGATVVADNVIDEANLKVSNTPTNGYFLSAQSGNTGGMTWAEVDALPSQSGNSGKFLTSNGSAASWATLNTDANTTTKGLYEHAHTISSNYTIGNNNNAMSAGPLTINSGVSVTIPSGSTFVIV